MRFKTITELLNKLYTDSGFRKSVADQNDSLTINMADKTLCIEFIDGEGELHKYMYAPDSEANYSMEIAEAITHAALKL